MHLPYSRALVILLISTSGLLAQDADLAPFLGVWVHQDQASQERVILGVSEQRLAMSFDGKLVGANVHNRAQDGRLRPRAPDSDVAYVRDGADLLMHQGSGDARTEVRFLRSHELADHDQVALRPLTLGARQPDAAERKQITAEFARRFAADQAVRARIGAIMGKPASEWTDEEREAVVRMHGTDKDNLTWFQAMLRDIGWPDRRRYGQEAAQAGLFLALHSHDIPLMMAVTAVLKEDRKQEMSYAMLSDRLALLMHEPQQYGVQVGSDGKGGMHMYVIADRTQLNANRRRIGLPPLEEMIKAYGERLRVVSAEEE